MTEATTLTAVGVLCAALSGVVVHFVLPLLLNRAAKHGNENSHSGNGNGNGAGHRENRGVLANEIDHLKHELAEANATIGKLADSLHARDERLRGRIEHLSESLVDFKVIVAELRIKLERK